MQYNHAKCLTTTAGVYVVFNHHCHDHCRNGAPAWLSLPGATRLPLLDDAMQPLMLLSAATVLALR